ncbi:MAG: hypothetical protein AAB558_00225 [Patescibacteria group bacterium]
MEDSISILRGPAILKRATELGIPASLEDAEWLMAHPQHIPTKHNGDLLVFTGTIRESGTIQTVPLLSHVSGQWKLYWTQLIGVWTPSFKLVLK